MYQKVTIRAYTILQFMRCKDSPKGKKMNHGALAAIKSPQYSMKTQYQLLQNLKSWLFDLFCTLCTSLSILPLSYHYVQLVPYFYLRISGSSSASFSSQFFISNLLVFALLHPWYLYLLSAYFIYSSLPYFSLPNAKFYDLLNSW